MTTLTVYDPPMCCSTGICGPAVDPVLPRLAADLDWLKRQGIAIERFNLAQQPQAFVSNPKVTAALRAYGNDCLPLVFVDGELVSRGTYPDRTGLARLAGLEAVAEPATSPIEPTSCCSGPTLITLGSEPGGSSDGCC